MISFEVSLTVLAARVCDIAAAEVHDADAVRQQDVPTLGTERPQDGVHPTPRRGKRRKNGPDPPGT